MSKIINGKARLSGKQLKPRKSAADCPFVDEIVVENKNRKRRVSETTNSSTEQLPIPKRSKTSAKKPRTTAEAKPKRAAKSPDHLKICGNIIKDLFSKKYQAFAWPFYAPVDVKLLGLYNYLDIIKQPMDLETIRKKISSRSYHSIEHFASDVRLVFTNCYTYNSPDHEVVAMAKKLEAVFEAKYDKIPIHLKKNVPDVVQQCVPEPDSDDSSADDESSSSESEVDDEEWVNTLQKTSEQITQLQSQVQSLLQNHCKRVKTKKKAVNRPQIKKGKAVWIDHVVPKTASPKSSGPESSPPAKKWNSDEDEDDRVPFDEIRQLILNVNKLAGAQLTRITQIIQTREPSYQGYDAGNIEIDFEKLSNSTIRELQKFVSSCFRNKPKLFGKSEPKSEVLGTDTTEANDLLTVVKRKSEKSTNEQFAERETELKKRLQDMNGQLGFTTKEPPKSDTVVNKVEQETGPNLSESSSSDESSGSSSGSSTSEED